MEGGQGVSERKSRNAQKKHKYRNPDVLHSFGPIGQISI